MTKTLTETETSTMTATKTTHNIRMLMIVCYMMSMTIVPYLQYIIQGGSVSVNYLL